MLVVQRLDHPPTHGKGPIKLSGKRMPWVRIPPNIQNGDVAQMVEHLAEDQGCQRFNSVHHHNIAWLRGKEPSLIRKVNWVRTPNTQQICGLGGKFGSNPKEVMVYSTELWRFESSPYVFWKIDREVYGGTLLRCCTRKGTVGSNPTSSAKIK